MALISLCNMCKRTKLIVPGEFVCYDCFPEIYKEGLTDFIKQLDSDKVKELEYLLEHAHLIQSKKTIRY